MRNRVMKLGERISLPAVDGNGVHTMCNYYVSRKNRGGFYILTAESRFTTPYERVVRRAGRPRRAVTAAGETDVTQAA